MNSGAVSPCWVERKLNSIWLSLSSMDSYAEECGSAYEDLDDYR